MKGIAGLLGRPVIVFSSGCEMEPGTIPTIDDVGFTNACATARTLTASSTFSASLILVSAAATSASLP
jgi:hypothetical protein